jgi:hypothetical protein
MEKVVLNILDGPETIKHKIHPNLYFLIIPNKNIRDVQR